MPIIPSYQSNVTPTAEVPYVLADPAKQTSSLQAKVNLGQHVEQLGGDIQQVGNVIYDIHEKQSKIKGYDAANQLNKEVDARIIKVKELQGNSVNHYKSISGKDEDTDIDLYTGETEQLELIKAKYSQSLDPMARAIFDPIANHTLENSRREIATHQATETRQYNAAVVRDTFEIAKQNIIDNPSNTNIEEQINRVTGIIDLHAGKADTELKEKMAAELRGVARNRLNANKVTTETVALQKEAREKFPNDTVAGLDYALTKATSPEWREDAMNRGIDEPAQQRIVHQLESSLTQQNKLYKNNSDKALSKFMLMLDSSGLDKDGNPVQAWRDGVNSFVFGKEAGLNGEDQKKFIHMANEKIKSEAMAIKGEQSKRRQEEADVRREQREKEHLKNEAWQAHQRSYELHIQEEHLKLEKHKDAVATMKDKVLTSIVSGGITEAIDIARIPDMDADTLKSLVPVLKDIKDSKAKKDALVTIDKYADSKETDPVKRARLKEDLHQQLFKGFAGKSDPTEIKEVVDSLIKENHSEFWGKALDGAIEGLGLKDALEKVDNFFKPKEPKPQSTVKAPAGYTYDSAKGYWVNPDAPKGKKAWRP